MKSNQQPTYTNVPYWLADQSFNLAGLTGTDKSMPNRADVLAAKWYCWKRPSSVAAPHREMAAC